MFLGGGTFATARCCPSSTFATRSRISSTSPYVDKQQDILLIWSAEAMTRPTGTQWDGVQRAGMQVQGKRLSTRTRAAYILSRTSLGVSCCWDAAAAAAAAAAPPSSLASPKRALSGCSCHVAHPKLSCIDMFDDRLPRKRQ